MSSDESHPIETELKLQLPDAAALARLRQQLGPPQAAMLQRNHYFDCEDRRWERAQWALRVRLSAASAWLTIKGSSTAQGAWTRRPELEMELGVESARQALEDSVLLRELAWKLAAGRLQPELFAAPLILQGNLATLRLCYRRALGQAELVLDRSHYPDGSVHCEVELECRDPQLGRAEEAWLRALFAEQGIAWQPSEFSKWARLRQILDRDSSQERRP